MIQNAEIAQLVEHNLAKVGVASSSLVFRSSYKSTSPGGGMVDALVSGTSVSNDVQVRVLFWARHDVRIVDCKKLIFGEVAELVDALL